MRTKSIITALIFIAFTSLFYNFKVKADEEKAETVIVTSQQAGTEDLSKIRIYYGDGNIETVPLGKFKGNIESMEEYMKTLSITLNKLNIKGFEVVSSTLLGAQYTFVLQRKK